MKRIYHVILVIVIATISINCQKELSNDNPFPSQTNNQSSPIISTLQGNVLDENDQPATGVKISAGTKITITDSRGYFRIIDAILDKNASLIIAEQPGYFKSFRTFKATSGVNQVVIKLIKKSLAGTADATAGGNVTLSNGAKIALSSNSVTSATGAAYSGNINVYAAFIDPTSNDIGKTVPGSFMGDDKDNKRVVLSSYGMLAVELESSAGEKLQIKPGSTATLTIPIPLSKLSSSPATISLWYIDEHTGIWKEQGTAKKIGNTYVGDVKHFSYWNCDISLPGISFTATFKTSDDVRLTNTYVTVRLANDTNGYAHGYTDSLGQVSGIIPANENLVLEVYDECYKVAYSKNIGPFTQNTDLGSISISNSTPSLVTIKGKLVSCSSTPVSNGYAILYFNNMVYNLNTNANGEFITSFFTCSVMAETCSIIGVDETTRQQGTLQTITLIPQITDAGDVTACGISSSEFINYTLDNKDYVISNAANDSFNAYTYAGFGALLYTSVLGKHSANNFLTFAFTGDGIAGVYPLNMINVIAYNSTILVKPFNVTITSFPQNIGEFYEGNFAGKFNDSLALSVKHDIKCSFRIRKNN